MIDVFLDAVLPIFAVVAVGYAFGRSGLFDFSAATALNRFVFYLALPLLLFRLIAKAPFDRFDWWLVLAFLLAEFIVYAVGFMVARYGFRRSPAESLLLGMATAFANQVFFVLPIARQLYGDIGALPVVAISIFDVVVLLVGTLLILDFTHNSDQGSTLGRPVRLLLRNPPIIGISCGVIANLAGLQLVGGLDLFAGFVGDSAAPVSLFALGLILMSQRNIEGLSVPMTMTGLKLILMPAVAWLLLFSLFPVSSAWANPALLVAAGPAGAMPFVFALQYKIPVASIAYTILISTVASLLTVTLVTQIG
jgi:malonate transporter